MIDLNLEIILTVVVLSFWFLFPVGMFFVVFHIDKNKNARLKYG